MIYNSEKANIQQLHAARASLDAFLPADQQKTLRPGWPEAYPSLHAVYERPPRNRGGFAGFLVMKQLHLPEESYERAQREVGLGEMPVNFTYLEQRGIKTMPPRLSIQDTEYTEVKAKYDWPPFRRTVARFVVGVTASEWATSEHGMQFSFMEIGSGDNTQQSFQAVPFGENSAEYIEGFFNEHSIYHPYDGEASVAALGSLASCVVFAQQG